ncbi:hypothetical protein TNCT_651351 [Trichonephila clavata]|uniref:Uncharacterized protein n=1 Tax=Trichonephila clavata TaxID=2740835 RepID=A0A8X6L1Q2_TRICU|nr:hypothetical protein TNCT_651351 [Trichonephila clavata]
MSRIFLAGVKRKRTEIYFNLQTGDLFDMFSDLIVGSSMIVLLFSNTSTAHRTHILVPLLFAEHSKFLISARRYKEKVCEDYRRKVHCFCDAILGGRRGNLKVLGKGH